MIQAAAQVDWIQKLADAGIPYSDARSIFEEELGFELGGSKSARAYAKALETAGERLLAWLFEWKLPEFFPSYPPTPKDLASLTGSRRRPLIYIALWRLANEGPAEPVDYRVSWHIDITASSPREAAEKALVIQQDPNSTATCFEVIAPHGRVVRIDLQR